MDFTNKTAISTGAASGMGLLFAQSWAAFGGNVLMCDVDEEVLEEKVSKINAAGKGKAVGVICDVRDYQQICDARDRAAEPQEIIDLCLFLASKKGQFINGENIMIDGGRNAMGRWI